jgi:cytochrome P450
MIFFALFFGKGRVMSKMVDFFGVLADSLRSDVKIDDHFIPKDTQILPLLWAVHMNPELWEDPEKFQPSRFINEDGKVQKPEYFMPFGIGKFTSHYLFFFNL